MSSAKLSNIPIETLQKELAKRLALVDRLKAQRDMLDQQIRQLEGAAGLAMDSSPKKSAPKPGKKRGPKPGRKTRTARGGAKTLGQYVAEVLAAAPAGMKINAIEQAVIKAGYVTKAETIYNPILKVIREGGFKKLTRGVYAAKATVNPLAEPVEAPKAPKAAKKAPKQKAARKRQKYAQTAEQFVLSLVKDKGAITSAINKAWQAAGRTGRADNTLNKMLKTGKLNRENIKGAKGSMYTVA